MMHTGTTAMFSKLICLQLRVRCLFVDSTIIIINNNIVIFCHRQWRRYTINTGLVLHIRSIFNVILGIYWHTCLVNPRM